MEQIYIYNKNSNNYYIVAQCKNYLNENSGDQLIKNIKKDIDASNQLPFYSKINKFIAMTSMDSDNKVQNEILSIKKTLILKCGFGRIFKKKFVVIIIYQKNIIQKYLFLIQILQMQID